MRRFVVAAIALAVAACGSHVPFKPTPHSSTTTTPTTPTAPTPPGAALGPAVGPVIDHRVNPACGTELWAKKTLTDADAARIDTAPVPISAVTQLNAVPDAGAQGPSRVGVELHVYRFTGKLLRAKLEADDDYHVVMQDASGKTLVTEYPAPVCVADADAAVRRGVDGARQAFATACGAPGSRGFATLSGIATIVGVGFYDRDHGQSGRDPLGDGSDVELHPVIDFEGSCRRTGVASAPRGGD